MSEAGKFVMTFDDLKSPMRLKLSARRICVLLRNIYADISGWSQSGRPQATRARRAEPLQAVRGALLAAAVMMALPAIMVTLSLLLRPQLHRWTNMVLGLLYTLVMLVAMLPGGWMFYLLLGGAEIALTLTIMLIARNRPAPGFNEITIWKHA
jgi:hypothetical protein